MKSLKKWIIGLLILAALIAGLILFYYFRHYNFYRGYQSFFQTRTAPEDTDFKALRDPDPAVEGFSLVAESDSLKLYLDEKTTNLAVYDKRSGAVTYAYPKDTDADGLANPTNKNTMKSCLSIYYMNSSNNQVTEPYKSYQYAVAKNQFTFRSLENGVRIHFELGDFESKTGIVPLYLSNARFEELHEQITAADASQGKTFANYYHENAEKGYYELASSGPSVVRKVMKALETVGYTQEDYYADLESSGAEGAVPVSFEATMDVILEDDALVIDVPTSELKEYGGAQIYQVALMNYFGAAGLEEEGYLVVPNGSGSLIRFNNGKEYTQSYMQSVYGIDQLSSGNLTQTEYQQPVRMPVFGIVSEDRGILGVIEEGDTLAAVNACVSKKVSSYNYVYPSFTLRTYETLSMNGGSMTVISPEMVQADLRIRYIFAEKQEDGYSYSDLAGCYRDYLIDKGDLTPLGEAEQKAVTEQDIPLYLDILGGVKETEFFLGAQYLSVNPMTTYKEAGEILDELEQGGVDRVVVNYQGWFNGGYYHNAPDNIKLVGKLGSQKELEALSDRLEASGGALYTDVAFQKQSRIAKGYLGSVESSKYYGSGHVAMEGRVNPTTFRFTATMGYKEILNYLVSPKFLNRYTESFAQKMQKIDVTGISLRDLTDELHSDGKRTEMISREQALDIVEAQLGVLDESGKQLMGSGGNAYSWRYLEDIINAPTEYSDFFMVDEGIPFYEMVIHGSINYSGLALNSGDNYSRKKAILECVEEGSYPHFVFTYKEATEMKYTGLNDHYSTWYENWMEDATEVWTEVNSALKYVTDAYMVNRTEPADGVIRVTYSNGVVIYINYNGEPASVDGLSLEAESYLVLTAGK
ncbi:MAG: hypothetical protein J5825_07530 [Lachnospiraceae bacterium]|nr:hypothetical protein [Lachnospiraceae bacterium]